MKSKSKKTSENLSRRDFIRNSTAAGVATILAGGGRLFAAGSDKIRIALIGCGSRGTDAVMDSINSSKGVELVAMADMFEDKFGNSLRKLQKGLKEQTEEKIKVTPEKRFLGFDAYKKVMACDDVDYVILATPPGFRPMHLRAAVEAGKHVFMEKPAAVDPVGACSVMKSSELADKKGVCIVAGTQQRRQPQYIEIQKRIENGDIGKVIAGQCYWDWGHSRWHFSEKYPDWSDMEWQIRVWPYFCWLGGDHIVEQHLHNLDIINWAMGSHPLKCHGQGGREVRIGKEFGNVFDHFAVEYEYPNGARVLSMCSQIDGTASRVGERIVGTKGRTHSNRSTGEIEYIDGRSKWEYSGETYSGLEKEHADLINSIRKGKHINEAKSIAESTLTAIMGRMSAYTGRALNWDFVMNSKLDLSPEKYEFGDLPVRPVAIPGKTLPI